ncbi:hypothetical protein [Pseudonocardia sp. GCM10023141]|uniref:hypothetical protein n=1 Tax=Pseudonocardia sp. GCM10023141 TaxID=3252653 RepID=UPI0036073158
MAAAPHDPVVLPVADGERHERLSAELRVLRVEGLARARDIAIPFLTDAASDLGHLDDGKPIGEAVESLLRSAVDRLGESREAHAALQTFGLARGTKLRPATDRRKAAAQAQGVSVERFRKGYEQQILSALADEMLSMIAFAQLSHIRPDPITAPVPVFTTREHRVPEVMAAARKTADWDLVERVYRQCVDIAGDQHAHFVPEGIVGFLAESFGRIAANYYGREDELVLHALAILGNIDRSETISPALFERLYSDSRFDRFRPYAGPAGRRPRPFESLVETARRYRDVNALRRVLSGVPTAGILGGSVNYGRFFTVRGARPDDRASDLDLMVVLPHYGLLDNAIAALHGVAAAARADVAAMAERARTFATHGLDDGRTVFAHKITMWADDADPVMAWAPNAGEYRLDLRFVSLDALDWLLVADTPKLNEGSAGRGRSVLEFCQPGSSPEDHQRSFSGRALHTLHESSELPGGLLRSSRVYTIDGDDERYYPGVLQNLVLPRFAQRWESVPINGRLEAFRWKVIERLRYERRNRPYELLRMSHAHTRSEHFAPWVLRTVDGTD